MKFIAGKAEGRKSGMGRRCAHPAWLLLLLGLSADGFEDALQQGRWRGRAPGDTSVHRDHLGNPAQGSIALAEDAARAAARRTADHPG